MHYDHYYDKPLIWYSCMYTVPSESVLYLSLHPLKYNESAGVENFLYSSLIFPRMVLFSRVFISPVPSCHVILHHHPTPIIPRHPTSSLHAHHPTSSHIIIPRPSSHVGVLKSHCQVRRGRVWSDLSLSRLPALIVLGGNVAPEASALNKREPAVHVFSCHSSRSKQHRTSVACVLLSQ